MEKYTIDIEYYDIETRSFCGDMCFYFQTTLESSVWCDSAKDMQQSFENSFNEGFIGENLDFPEIHHVCRVVDEFGMIDNAITSNIVLLQNYRYIENEIREKILQRYPNTEINVWYK